MRRREFIWLAASAAVWPYAASAEPHPGQVIGLLNGSSAEGYAPMMEAFRLGLREEATTFPLIMASWDIPFWARESALE